MSCFLCFSSHEKKSTERTNSRRGGHVPASAPHYREARTQQRPGKKGLQTKRQILNSCDIHPCYLKYEYVSIPTGVLQVFLSAKKGSG